MIFGTFGFPQRGVCSGCYSLGKGRKIRKRGTALGQVNCRGTFHYWPRGLLKVASFY